MFCGILSRCDQQSVHQLALTRFAIMCEKASAAIDATTPMEIQTDDGADIDIDADDEISVGSASPPPVPCDTDESMPPPQIDTTKVSGTAAESTAHKKLPEEPSKELHSAAAIKEDAQDSSVSPGASRTPPVAHQSTSGNVQRSLKFSIDNILKPDFGTRLRESLRHIGEQPVDLSRVNDQAIGSRPPVSETAEQHTFNAKEKSDANENTWPAWVFCTRYSDRPSAGPRTRRIRQKEKKEEKRPRTAFSNDQLSRLKKEFQENRYLTEKRRQDLARELVLNESQIKIWFQNKRAKIKKQGIGSKNPLALKLMAQGLYNHSTIAVHDDEEEKLLGLI